jgi:polyribonucleotide nucleotidyltransferase
MRESRFSHFLFIEDPKNKMAQKGITKTFDIGDGRMVSIETGKLATQADGSVVVRLGDCMLLATVVSNKEAKEGQDFFPLSVDYQEKFAAAGRIPGTFFRREGKISDYEVLISRLVDRVLRPLFPEDYLCDTQVLISVISIDKNVQPDTLAALAASAALTISDIPFKGPISEVRVCKIGDKYVINPSKEDADKATIDIIVGASTTSVVMVEGEAKECSESEMVEAIKVGHDAVKKHCAAQLELCEMLGGRKPSRTYKPGLSNEEVKAKVYELAKSQVYDVCKSSSDKNQRKLKFAEIKEQVKAAFAEGTDEEKYLAKKYYSDLEFDTMRNMILDEGIRLDGRSLEQVRPIWMELDYLPGAHGSSIFTRGETQSLTTVTLGTKLDEQMIDKAADTTFSKFFLHYNFPAFSTGEVKPNRGPGRREVGHGNLAQRSLKNALPDDADNPYTIRIVSDILESNGSSSMATVCAGSLALYDAGVKMKSHVSGIAMGLITREDGKSAILSDILGDEDHLGDMDFKVTGTRKGICACQMDIKIEGLSYALLEQALMQANKGRNHIIELMYQSAPQTRTDYKAHVPRIVKLFIDREYIGAVIGPGGKIIQEMQRETGCVITIEEKDNRGEVTISSANAEGLNKAVAKIKGITMTPEVNEVYEGKVKSILAFGAFVEFLPGKDGLLHISEVSHKRLETLEGVLKVGDMIKVKLVEVDKKTGKFKLSRKVLIDKNEVPVA